MLEEEMPPNMAAGAGKKKNRKDKQHPVQQVQPQPQKPPSPGPDFPPLDNIDLEKGIGSSSSSDEAPKTVLMVEPGAVTREAEEDLFKDEEPLITTACSSTRSSGSRKSSDNLPVAPPRSQRATVSPTIGGVTVGTRSSSSQPAASPVVRPATTTRDRTPSISYNKGQVVKPTVVPASSIAGSVVELVHDAMPTQQPTTTQAEKVEWVQFHTIEKAGEPGKQMDLILFGLARGFQLWTVLENGDMEEVMSERQGPIRAFLPIPNNIRVDPEAGDSLSEFRPMVALVDAFSYVPDRQFCSVSLVSLVSKKVIRLPSSTTAFEEPVTNLHASDGFLIVCLSSRLLVYDTASFCEVRSLRVATPPDGLPPTVAVNDQLLAYADQKLCSDVQSCGGLEETENVPPDYVSQAMSVAKNFSRAVVSLGDSVSGATSTKSKDLPKGIMTVVDMSKEEREDSSSVIAHWVAHMDPLSFCSWSPDGRLLVTADVNATCFNVFSILPHAVNPALGAVQHLYKLHRGSTAARVVSSCFSLDSRWLAIATNHGTTHVFAICPYGGKPTNRTHSDHFTNRESRFLRSAGLIENSSELQRNNSRHRIHSGVVPVYRDHPALSRNRMLARCSGNSRIGPFPPPVLLTAVKKIRDPRISADNLTAWATDLNPVPLSSSSSTKRGRAVFAPRVSLLFSSYATDARVELLLIARAETGVVCEYELRARQPVSKEKSEDAPKLEVTPLSMWTLQRTKNNADIPPPVQNGSPLLVLATKNNQLGGKGNRQWIPQIEMCTYSGPARRLWMGPQFSFFEYNEDQAPELVTPSDSRNSLSSMKSIPVMIGKKSAGGAEDIDTDEATRVECGSWVSQASIQIADESGGGDISQKIADAMREIAVEVPAAGGGQMQTMSFIDDFSSNSSPHGERRQPSTDEEELLQFDDM